MRGTNWSALRVDEMWAMIERHDGAAHQQLIGGWRKSYELVLQHISGVQRYRDGLAAAWPPNRSAAAAAYMVRLDALIASLRETYEAAVENHRALSGATGALDSARRSMDGIRREYAVNEMQLAAYREEVRVHHLVGGKAKGMPPQPPALDGRQVELERQARTVMSNLSAELAQAQVALIKPTAYRNIPNAYESRLFKAGSDTVTQPLVGRTPTLTDQLGEVAQRTVTATDSNEARHRPPAQYFPPRSNLGGVVASSSLGRSSSGAATIPQHGNSLPGVIGGSTPAASNATGPSEPRRSDPQVGRVTVGSNRAISSREALPPGGVIGAPSPTPARLPAADGTPQRALPTGGVLAPTPTIPPSNTPQAARQSRKVYSRARSTDNPWATTEGIPPVIQPSPEAEIDPGPALGLRRK